MACGSFADPFQHLFELFGAGLNVAIEAATGHFDGHDRRHAVGEADHGRGDALGVSEFRGAIKFHAHGERIQEPVRDQDPKEGSHEGGSDVMPDLFDGPGDGTHGDHDAEHGRDDAEAGHGVGGLGEDTDGLVMLAFHRLELYLHEGAELIWFDLPIDDGPQAAAKKLESVMIFGDGRVFVEDGAAARIGDVFFQGAGSFFTLWHPDELYRMGEGWESAQAACRALADEAGKRKKG